MSLPIRIVFDLETYSEAALEDTGSEVYSRHPSTDAMCGGWVGIDDAGMPAGPVETWVPGQPPPAWARDPEVEVWAWNVRFDQQIYDRVLVPRYGWPARPPGMWRCLMARAAYGNLPLRLELAAVALRAEACKDTAGHLLMMRLSRPAKSTVRTSDPKRHHTAAAVARLLEYCRADVAAEAGLFHRLPALPPMEEAAFALDQVINARGILVDQVLLDACEASILTLRELHREDLRRITRGAVEDENQLDALVGWLAARGVPAFSGQGGMDKDAVAGYLATVERHIGREPTPELDDAAGVLRIRQANGRSAHAKFAKLRAGSSADGRLRGAVQYGGAHQTLRWAGRAVQTQNMPKGILGSDAARGPTYATARELIRTAGGDVALPVAAYGDGVVGVSREMPGLPAVVSSLLRCCFVAKPGHVFAIADYAAVEARGVIWLSEDVAGMTAFCDGADLYCLAASAIEGRTITKADKERNTLGKPTVLGCGYGMGPAKFAATFDLSEEMGAKAVQAYRGTFSGVPRLWKDVERAAVAAVRDPGSTHRVGRDGRVAFRFGGQHLLCRLPSGRCLWYRDACLVEGPFAGTVVVEFASENGKTKQWQRGTIWGGTFVENIVQALCRDLLLFSMHECEREALPVVLHIHDEVLCEVPAPETPAAERALVRRLEEVMARLPAWAEGFPAKVEGFLSPYWRK